MPRPCGHRTHTDGCPACAWCRSPTETGRGYRRLWGEPEPGGETIRGGRPPRDPDKPRVPKGQKFD